MKVAIIGSRTFKDKALVFEKLMGILKYVDVEAIKKFAECNDYHPKFDNVIENQFVEQYTELFSKIAYLNG